MKFWEKFSKTIYSLILAAFRRRIEKNSFELVLKKALELFDEDTVFEIKGFLKSQFTSEGAFADKGGKADIYYSLFGLFISEALGEKQYESELTAFVKQKIKEEELSDVHVFCLAIMHSKLCGADSDSLFLKKRILRILNRKDNQQFQYLNFMGLLALYYQREFYQVWKLLRNYTKKTLPAGNSKPCTVIAAECILRKLTGKGDNEALSSLNAFNKGNGGFVALKQSPIEDLLTTAVALFALHFCGEELTALKPDSMEFIDSLYEEGGFCATIVDHKPDVEYTFYGLLGLGVLVD